MSWAFALLALMHFIIVGHAVPAAQFDGFEPSQASDDGNHFSRNWGHSSYSGHQHSQSGHHFSDSSQYSSRSQFQRLQSTSNAPSSTQQVSQSAQHSSAEPSHFSQSAHAIGSHSTMLSSSVASSAPLASSSSAAGLDPNAMNCQVALPSNALTAEGLSTPWELLPPCSQAVSTQQAFAEAAVIDSNGQVSIYHPLIIDKGKTPQAAPIVPTLDGGSQVALFFGFNGNVLTLVDFEGQDVNTSPTLMGLGCVNGLKGVQGDVFGQVSWCNTQPFWNAANAAVESHQLEIPALGTNDIGKPCLSARSFEIIDQDQSDNLPTKYLLLSDGSTVQFTMANQAKFSTVTEIDNASDESLTADFVDPAIGCTPFMVDSIDDPGAQVSSLATNELQALFTQQEPIALVPLNDPDTLLTASGAQSSAKTNEYRLGVNQPLLGTSSNTDDGSGQVYCNHLVDIQPPFLASFQDRFSNAMTPDAGIGNNLFTFLCNRFLQSLTNLDCPNTNIPVKCTLDGDGAATACTIGTNTTMSASSSVRFSTTEPSQSFETSSSMARSQSFRTPSSSASRQGSITMSSNRQSQSFEPASSATPVFSSTSHGFGNYSAPASTRSGWEVQSTPASDPWFVR